MAKVSLKIDDNLLRKIRKNIGDKDVDGWLIHDGVEYGVFQEFGSSGRPARPFLTPAFEKATQQLPAAIGAAIEAGIDLNDIISKVAFDIQSLAQIRAPVDTGALKNSIEAERL